jgi:hypothetical protein
MLWPAHIPDDHKSACGTTSCGSLLHCQPPSCNACKRIQGARSKQRLFEPQTFGWVQPTPETPAILHAPSCLWVTYRSALWWSGMQTPCTNNIRQWMRCTCGPKITPWYVRLHSRCQPQYELQLISCSRGEAQKHTMPCLRTATCKSILQRVWWAHAVPHKHGSRMQQRSPKAAILHATSAAAAAATASYVVPASAQMTHLEHTLLLIDTPSVQSAAASHIHHHSAQLTHFP